MKSLRIHYIQHVPFEGIGMTKEWILQNKFQLTSTKLFNNDSFPDVSEFDFLIVMGGPMSIHDEAQFPWLAVEKKLIKSAFEHNKIVLGICLGAQLIADVLGANVLRNTHKEIGFFPLQPYISSAAENLATKFTELLSNQIVFHWHGETFDLPENTIRLSASLACENQAFLYKENVLGLQFHLEMNETAIQNIIENCREELIESKFIQSENTIKQEMKNYIPENRKLLFKILDLLAK